MPIHHDAQHWCELVAARTPINERERESIEKFLSLAPILTDPFNEHADLVHITASAIVVSDAGDKVALHMHKRLNMWLQPGGHIEAGETAAQGALREAEEEIGLPVRHESDGGVFVHVDVHAGPKGHTHLDLRYVVRALMLRRLLQKARANWCSGSRGTRQRPLLMWVFWAGYLPRKPC